MGNGEHDRPDDGPPYGIGPEDATRMMPALVIKDDRTAAVGNDFIAWMESVAETDRNVGLVQFIVTAITENGTRWEKDGKGWRFIREPDYSDALAVVSQFEAVLRVAQQAVGGKMNPSKLPPLLQGCIELTRRQASDTNDTARVPEAAPVDVPSEDAEPGPEVRVVRTEASEAATVAMLSPFHEEPRTEEAVEQAGPESYFSNSDAPEQMSQSAQRVSTILARIIGKGWLWGRNR